VFSYFWWYRLLLCYLQSLIGPEKAWGILDLGEWLVLPAAESDN